MSISSEPGWADALAAMNKRERATAAALRDHFAGLGADDPEGWALSEIREDIPQLARFLALRGIWPELIDRWVAPGVVENLPAAARLLAAGADRDDVVQVARTAAYEAAFGLLFRLTAEGRDGQAPDDTPGWSLMETTGQDRLTGRPIQALHEDLLAMDPSGRDGQDLFQ